MQLTRVAASDGWRLTDFVRALVVLAATVTWLKSESKESQERLRRLRELGSMYSAMKSLNSAHEGGRPYAPRRPQRTEVTPLIIPNGLARYIESYAKAHGRSKNALCTGLLTNGLFMYMKGEAVLLRSMVPDDENLEPTDT